MRFDLEKYENKKVAVIDIDDIKHIGIVTSYTQPNDNEGEEAISLSTGIWLNESDINSIALA